MLADTPTSPVDETPQPTSGEALLRRVRETRRRAQVLRAAARAARQRAKAVQEYARHYNTLACAARVVRRYLITHLNSHASVRSTTLLPMRHVPPLAGRANHRQRSMGDCTKAVASLEPSRPGAITIIVVQYPSVTVLAVRGNGRSIAEDDRPRLLEPCRRAGRQDVPGEGRGFASVRMRIRRHEGAITWQSTLGVGIAFTCTMTHTLPHEISYAWHTTVTMLLVGDDPSMPG